MKKNNRKKEDKNKTDVKTKQKISGFSFSAI